MERHRNESQGVLRPRERDLLEEALPDHEIGEELGRGACGLVVAARHRRLGREVAVKLLAPGLDPDVGARFLTEARVLASLDHPHVVPVYDYVDAGGACLLIMERLAGGTIKQRLAAGMSPQAACAVVVAACAGLHYAHGMRVLHRDVKPQNLLVSADGVVKVADFGIAKVLAGSTSVATQPGVMLGTPSYMAPEQVEGVGLSASVDVYAAGVVFYELLCGELPFAPADDPLAAMYQRVHGRPVPLLERAPQLPPSLSAITDRALQRDPAERYASADELAGAIARAAGAQWGPDWIADTGLVADVETPAHMVGRTIDLPRARSVAVPTPAASKTPFVGRDDDLRRLHESFDRVRGGRLQVAMIGGEPGIGKTRLAGEFARAARAEGVEVLCGRSDEALAIPYQPIAEMLRSYFARAPVEASVDAALAPLMPELGDDHPSAVPGADPAEQRHRLFAAVATFLTKLSAARPSVLVFDDLHWADPPTVQLLRYLARSPTPPAVLMIGTYRDTEASRSGVLEQLLADLQRDGDLAHIALQGLSERDFGAMVESVGVENASADLVHALHVQTAGNPFFGGEALRHLRETGAITEHGSWTTRQGIEALGVPAGVKATIRGRLARLPPPSAKVFAHAAVLGRTWEYEVLQATEPADDEELLECVDAALAARLIVEAGEARWPTYSFTHALVRETLYDGLILPRRQRLHLKAAQAIERVHGRELDDHVSSLAMHHRLAGSASDPAIALGWSLRAGELAAAQYAWEEVAAHLDHALELMPAAGVAPEHRARLQERVGDLKFAASFDVVKGTAQLEEALAHYEAIGERARAARTRSRIGRNLATYGEAVHDVRRAREHFAAAEPVLREEGDGVPLALLYVGLANAATWTNHTAEIVRAAEHAVGIATRLGNDGLWANAAALLGWGKWIAGEVDDGRRLMEEAWDVANRLNHPYFAFLATWCAQGAAGWLGEPREVLRWCDRELAKPRVVQASGQREVLDSFRGWGSAFAGDLEEARAVVDRNTTDLISFAAGVLELMGGDPARAAEVCARSRSESAQRGNTWVEMCMGIRLGQAQWLLGVSDMEATYRDALRLAVDGGAVAFELIIRAALAPRLVELGRLEEARGEARRCRELFDSGGSWSARAGDVALAEAVVDAAAARDDQAEQGFVTAIAEFKRFGVVFDEAEAWYRWGLALTDRDPVAANTKLDAAMDIYIRHGAGERWRDLVTRARDGRA